jgi:hypothetical protein
MYRPNRIEKLSGKPSLPCTCLVIERGAAIEFLEDADLESIVDSQLQDSQVVIVVKTPDGVLNSIGCEPHQIVGVISDAFKIFNIKNSRWDVLCSPAVRVVATGLLSGAYARFRDGTAVAA